MMNALDKSPHPAISAGNLAVITGGASGIGLACAAKFLSANMRVCLVDRSEEALDTAASEFRKMGFSTDDIITKLVDVSDCEQLEALAAGLGPVSVLMNNAAIGGGGSVLAKAKAWERLISINLMGVFYGVNAFAPAIVESGQPGLIINTGSKQGITQPPGNTAYNVAKSGVKSLTEGLAHTLREETDGRVTAHLLVPGFTYTGMMKRHLPEKPDAAWTPEQVADYLFEALAKNDFYIICPDNETTLETDRKRMSWAAGDVINNRPALSRWHPGYKAEFEEYMKE